PRMTLSSVSPGVIDPCPWSLRRRTAWLRRSRAPRSGPPARTARGSYTYGPRGSSSGPRGRGRPGGRCAPDAAGRGRGPPGHARGRLGRIPGAGGDRRVTRLATPRADRHVSDGTL